MNHGYKPGDWIAFQTYRSVGQMNEQTLAIEIIAYRSMIASSGVTKPAYITNSGKKVAEDDILEIRRALVQRTEVD